MYRNLESGVVQFGSVEVLMGCERHILGRSTWRISRFVGCHGLQKMYVGTRAVAHGGGV